MASLMKCETAAQLYARIAELERETKDLRAESRARSRAERELRERLQLLSQSKQELERIVINIAHDLQQPLRLIREYAARAGSSGDDRAVLTAIDRVKAMIESWLGYIRAGRGRELPAELADMNAALMEAQAVCEPLIRDAGAVVTADPLPTVTVRAAQFVRVFQNLLTNALKYRDQEHTPRIHIAAARESDEWLFSVQDNGIGFTREDAGRIFDLFTRLHGSAYPGAGVGLAICKRIVERHGGRIWAESRVEGGAQFYFTVPCGD